MAFELQRPSNAALAAQITDPSVSGIRPLSSGAQPGDDPSPFTIEQSNLRWINEYLARCGQGCVFPELWSGGSLNVRLPEALSYRIGATEYTLAAVESFACTASVVNYLYVDADQTLKKNSGSWPAGDIFKLAKVTCSGSAITGIVDVRLHNMLVGIVNAWSSVDATETVDMAGFDIEELGWLGFDDPTELTIASGAITPTQSVHTVDTEADAGTDDLTTITSSATDGHRRLLLLAAANGARTVVVKATGGNLTLPDGDFSLDDADKRILLVDNGAGWTEVARSFHYTAAELVTATIAELVSGSAYHAPYSPTFYLSGLLSNKVYEQRFYAPFAFVIKRAIGTVDTAPTATACIIDVRVNGSSIFSNQGEMVNIAAAANTDVSATKNHVVAAGDEITIEVEQHSSAEDAVVVLEGYAKFQTSPV